MTTHFDSKRGAIATGMYYAGRQDLYKDDKGNTRSLEDILKSPEIKVIDGAIAQFGDEHEDNLIIEFPNRDKKVCRIATTKFRDGFDLWIVHPESGAAIRV